MKFLAIFLLLKNLAPLFRVLFFLFFLFSSFLFISFISFISFFLLKFSHFFLISSDKQKK